MTSSGWGRVGRTGASWLCISVLAVMLGLGSSSWAAIITVNTTDDELNGDGDCSLREAIRAANLNAAIDGCTAGSGDDTIIIPDGTYILTVPGAGEDAAATGDLDITDDVDIFGANPATTIRDCPKSKWALASIPARLSSAILVHTEE